LKDDPIFVSYYDFLFFSSNSVLALARTFGNSALANSYKTNNPSAIKALPFTVSFETFVYKAETLSIMMALAK